MSGMLPFREDAVEDAIVSHVPPTIVVKCCDLILHPPVGQVLSLTGLGRVCKL